MRNLNDYLNQYINLPFERIQTLYRRRRLLSLLNEYNPLNILEIGCGFKPLFINYNSFNTFSIVEPIEAFYKSALKEARNNNKIILINNFLEDSIEKLNNIEYDFIILSSLLHEVESPQKFLESVHSICSENTILCTIVPNSNSFHRLLALSMEIIDSEDTISNTQFIMQQNNIYNHENLSVLLKKSGFKSFMSETFFIKPFTHKQMQKMLDYRVINTSVLDGLYDMSSLFPDMGSELMHLSKVIHSNDK